MVRIIVVIIEFSGFSETRRPQGEASPQKGTFPSSSSSREFRDGDNKACEIQFHHWVQHIFFPWQMCFYGTGKVEKLAPNAPLRNDTKACQAHQVTQTQGLLVYRGQRLSWATPGTVSRPGVTAESP